MQSIQAKLVEIMADIESTFCHVCVPEEYKNFFRFLWWEHNDANNEPLNRQMCVNTFDEISSLSCCHYALKLTSIEIGKQFGREVAKIFQKNFCVNNMLKSVSNKDEAINLVEGVMTICQKDGF